MADINGSAGNDTLVGTSGADRISGGAGNDSISGGGGVDLFVFQAGDGRDFIRDLASGETVEIRGYSSAQSINEYSGNVVVVFAGGDQIIFLNTTLARVQSALHFVNEPPPPTATDDADVIAGTAGDDTINALGGDDTVDGLTGSDSIDAGAGSDTVFGGEGDDLIAGGAGADALNGGEGQDRLFSGEASPTWSFPYYGSPYDPPLLDHGQEVDTLNGGVGDDLIFAGYGDNVDGGDGNDYLYISFQGAESGVSADFRDAVISVGGGTIQNVENVSWLEGSDHDDSIIMGSDSPYTTLGPVFGMAGNDTLVAGYYTGSLDGGDGDDIVDGRNSQYLQQVDGGAGDDILYTNANTFAVAEGGAGNDTIYAHGEIHGGSGNDTIHVVYSYYPGPVNGEAGDDTIIGNVATDLISGGAGNDTLTGGDGDDRFTFGAGDGHDTITDFAAGDTLEISSYGGFESLTQVGDDVILVLSSEDQVTFTNADLATVESAISFIPTNDLIYGGSGDDTLRGYGGDDEIYGQAGSDTLLGGDGDDALVGGVGSDTLEGGAGNDLLISNDDGAGIATGQPLYASLSYDRGVEADVLLGGDGSDIIIAGYGDTVDGGADGAYGDLLWLSFQGASQGIAFEFSLGAQEIGGAVITGVEGIGQFEGSNFDDLIDLRGANLNAQQGSSSVGGMSGNDHIMAGEYTFVIAGDDGNDLLDASASLFCHIDGGAGDDQIIGDLSGKALVSGGDGDDDIAAGGTVHGDDGNDSITLTSASTATGDKGDDNITGSSGVDQIAGGAGADYINGAGGDDELYSGDRTFPSGSDWGSEHDVVLGGAGDDEIHGGYGDTLDGGVGLDTLYLDLFTAGSGVAANFANMLGGQTIQVGEGTISGFEAIEEIRGSTFDDVLTFASQSVQFLIDASNGNDIITVNGNAAVNGGHGDDLFISGDGADNLIGSYGSDTVDYRNSTAAVSIALQEPLNGPTLGASGDTLYDIENIAGSAFADTLTGNSLDNVLSGAAGSDTLNGGAGNDTLSGNSGMDTFLFAKGGGKDIVTDFQSGEALKITGYSSAQSITQSGANVIVVFSSTDQVTLQNSTVAVVQAGLQLDPSGTPGGGGSTPTNTINGTARANTLVGTSANDAINGLGGGDTIDGGAGNDTLSGGSGTDTFIYRSGGGTDTITDFVAGEKIRIYDYTAAQSVVQSGSNVIVTLAANNNITVQNSTVATVNGGLVYMSGSSGGGGGGSTPTNTINGTARSNTLIGTSANDAINGLGGGDTIDGRAGNDTLSGGTGSDVFLYSLANSGADRITDFVSGTDKINLHAFGITSANVQTAVSGANLVISVDADRNGINDFTITLTGVTQISLTDYIF